MDRLNHPLARASSYLLIYVTAVQPVLAAGITSSQPATQVQAGTVPVVNIATPNGAGISHNRYEEFNVGTPGAVLNNATQAGNAQLAGALNANPNLQGNAARLIINEVTGSGSSDLQGQIEVFGQRADLLIANPNGIKCDGCGTINSAGITLTTGKPQLDVQGSLQALEVKKGRVNIGSGGLNGDNADYVEIISRATELNGKITAKKLALTQGANRIDYRSGEVKPIAGAGAAPQLAVDSKALGGMYAGQIRLLATEEGVGVNLGNLTSTQQSIELDANGQISITTADAKTHLNVRAQAIALAADAALKSAGDITLASQTLSNRGKIEAQGNVRLFSDRVSNSGPGAVVQAGKNMWIQKDAQGNKASLAENRSATLKTVAGDLVMRTEQLDNVRDRLVLRQEDAEYDEAGMYLFDTSFNAKKYKAGERRSKNGDLYVKWRKATDGYQLIAHMFDDQWINNSSYRYLTTALDDPSVISSGKDLFLNSSVLNNHASKISAKDNVFLTGSDLNVRSYSTGGKKEFLKYIHDVEADKQGGGYLNFKKTGEKRAIITGKTDLNSNITAGKDLVADFKEQISVSTALPFMIDSPTEVNLAERTDTFSAGNILIHAGKILSNDNMSAIGNISLIAEDSIIQQRGTLSAGKSLSLTAVNNIVNRQSVLKGHEVALLSRQGDIISAANDDLEYSSVAVKPVVSETDSGNVILRGGLVMPSGFQATKNSPANVVGRNIYQGDKPSTLGKLSLANSVGISGSHGAVAVTKSNTMLAGDDYFLQGVKVSAGESISVQSGVGISANHKAVLATGEIIPSAADNKIRQELAASSGGSLSITVKNESVGPLNLLTENNAASPNPHGEIIATNTEYQRYFTADGTQKLPEISADILTINAAQGIMLSDTLFNIQHSINAVSGGDLTISNNDRLLTPSYSLQEGATLTPQAQFDKALMTPGRLSLSDDITLAAGGNLMLDGISLQAGKNIALTAGHSVSLNLRQVSDQVRLSNVEKVSPLKYFPDTRTPELRASLNAGNDLQIHAGADILAQGTLIKSGANSLLYAGRNLTLDALAYSFIDAKNDNNKDDRQLVTEISAGNNLTLAANGALTANGSTLASGNDMTITSGSDMAFNAVETHVYREFDRGYSEAVKQQNTSLNSGGALTLISSGSILFQATKLLAKTSLDAAAKGGFLYAQAMEESSSYEKTTKHRKWYGKKKTIRQTSHNVTNKVTEFTAGENISLLSRDDSTFEASKINAGKNARLTSTAGKVNFVAVKNSAFDQTVTTSKGFFIKQSDRGYKSDTWVLPTIHTGGGLVVEAASGISADVKAQNGRQLQATLKVLGSSPGMEWLQGLSGRSDVQWNRVQDAYESWDYSHQSLNPAVAAVIAIAAAAVTAGSGLAGVAGSAAAGSAGGTAGTVAYGAGYSGMMALSSQAAVALVENQGNLSKALNQLGSSDSVKALATSMAIGGALAGFDRVMGFEAANPGNARLPQLSNGDWSRVAQRVAGQTLISSSLNTAINGGSFRDNLSNALLSTLGDQLNAEGASLIGDNGEVLGAPGKVLSHAVVSGISAEIAGGSGKGGAVGALAAELAGILMQSSLFEPAYLNETERQIAYLQQALSGGSEAQAQTARFVGALAGAFATHTPDGVNSAANSAELVYRYNMTEHQLTQNALDNQHDILAADKGDQSAAERVIARREAAVVTAVLGSGGMVAVVGGTVLVGATPELLLAARLALAGCQSNPVLCVNQAAIYAADIAAPDAAVGTGAAFAGTTLVLGRSKEEAAGLAKQVATATESMLKGRQIDKEGLEKTIVAQKLTGEVKGAYNHAFNTNPLGNISIAEDRVGHIFRNAEGHILDTPQHRKIITEVANDQNAVLGFDRYGNNWSSRILPDGSQVWVQTRGDKVINAGVNNPPKIYSSDTGLSSLKPRGSDSGK